MKKEILTKNANDFMSMNELQWTGKNLQDFYDLERMLPIHIFVDSGTDRIDVENFRSDPEVVIHLTIGDTLLYDVDGNLDFKGKEEAFTQDGESQSEWKPDSLNFRFSYADMTFAVLTAKIQGNDVFDFNLDVPFFEYSIVLTDLQQEQQSSLIAFMSTVQSFWHGDRKISKLGLMRSMRALSTHVNTFIEIKNNEDKLQ